MAGSQDADLGRIATALNNLTRPMGVVVNLEHMIADLATQVEALTKAVDTLANSEDAHGGKLVALGEMQTKYLASLCDQQAAGFKAIIAGQRLIDAHLEGHCAILERIARSLEGRTA